MQGLIVKEYWLKKILSGEKPWEIRSTNTKKRGKIALIQSGTSKIFAYANLVDSFPVTREDLERNKDKHCIEDLSIISYKKPHAWVLNDIEVLDTPIPYKHKQGAVIWVNI